MWNKRIKNLEKETHELRGAIRRLQDKIKRNESLSNSQSATISNLINLSMYNSDEKYSQYPYPNPADRKPIYPLNQVVEALLEELGFDCERIPPIESKVIVKRKD